MAEERRINLRVSPDEYRALNKKRFEENTSFQDVGLGLLRAWLSGDKKPEDKATRSPYVVKLEHVLASGDEQAISAVTQNVDFFYDRLRPQTKHPLSRARKTGT